jgi:hypothetical protein
MLIWDCLTINRFINFNLILLILMLDTSFFFKRVSLMVKQSATDTSL